MTVEVGFARILVYLLVFVRLVGMIQMNPLFGRTSIPGPVRLGLVLMLSLLLAPIQPEEAAQAVYAMNTVSYAFAAVRELAIGFVFGYVFQMFYYFLFYVGDQVDTDIGFTMAKAFDPQTNIQTGISSSIFTLLFSLYIFLTGSHLTLIHIFADTFSAISVGSFTFNAGILNYALALVSRVFLLVIRLAAPFIVAEFTLQFCMGILMKFVPQITIFVVNFQIRILLGMLMLFLFAPFFAQFIDNYIETLFDDLLNAAAIMAAT